MADKPDRCAADVMSTPVLSIPPDTPVDGIERIMRNHAIGAVPITDEAGRLLGIVTDADLRRNLEAGENSLDRTAGELSSGIVTTIRMDTPVSAIAALFRRSQIHHVPVVSEGRLVGMVSATDLGSEGGGRRTVGTVALSDEAIRSAIEERLLEMVPCLDRMPNFCIVDGTVRFWETPPTADELDAVMQAVSAIESPN